MSNDIIMGFERIDAPEKMQEASDIQSVSRGLMLMLQLLNPERLIKAATPQQAHELRCAIKFVNNMSNSQMQC